MHRSGTKRKSVETLLDYEEFAELESEIKIEPPVVQCPDDAALSDECCCLCKISFGDKLAVFGNGPKHDPDIANKIQSCLGLKISVETYPSTHICRGCLQQLDGHDTFRKQALKCNEYTQNKMAEAGAEFNILSEEIRVCRFCLKIGKKLLDMHPGGESPEYDLLQSIRECLGIEVNSWDPITKICRDCIKKVNDSLTFRTRYPTNSDYIKDEIWHYGPSKLAKRIKSEDEDAGKQNLDLNLSVSDSDCSSEEKQHTDFTFAGRQTMRPELVQLIGAEADGKNFTALSEDDKQMKVIFDDQLFRFHSERENGSSLWTCDNIKLRNCRAKLKIDATGRCASSAGARNHCHPPGTVKLLHCPLGNGMTEINGKSEPFYMFSSNRLTNRSVTNYTRSLIFQGFRYFLHQIRVRGITSVWYCVRRRPVKIACKATLTCYGIFHKVETSGKHNHGKLAQHDIQTLLQQHEVDTTSTDAISQFQNVNTIEKITEPWTAPAIKMSETARIEIKSLVKEKNPQIFRLLKQDDAERNFEAIKIGAKFKLVQEGYEYRYYGELSDKSTIWKCVMQELRYCKILAKITPDGKHLEIYKGRHSHGKEVEDIFHYPLGKRMIDGEPLWLLNKDSLYNENRYIVYREYLFCILNINQKGEVRWSCIKKKCGAMLSTKGNFQEVVLRNEHSHEKPPKRTIIKLLNGWTTSNVDTDSPSLKQKLLSYIPTKTKIWDEGANEYETLYILTDVIKDTPNGFIFRGHKFTFKSVDQHGTTKWLCWKRIDTRGACCGAVAIVEGRFETILVTKQHSHEMMSDSLMKHLIKQYACFPNSSGKQMVNLVEIPDHKQPTGNILTILARHDAERNFTLARANGKLLVNYEGEGFRLKSRGQKGISTWRCTWLSIRKCQVSLQMSADGKQVAYVDPRKQHNHADEQIGVFLKPPGKGQIYDKDKDIVSSYWLFNYQSELRSSRGIIYQGNKHTLHTIGNNNVSWWRCRVSLCKAEFRVGGMFKTIDGKHEHNHARLTDDELKDITGQEKVDKDLLPNCENSNAIVRTSNRPLRFSDILKIMSLDDPDRNFQIKTHKEKMKIIHEGYEFVYRSSTPSHTLWRCIYSGIRICHVTLQIDNDCKQAIRSQLLKHTHFLKPSNLFDYPLGESEIMDTETGSKKPLWFLMQPTFVRPKPFIIYENHRYWMVYIAEKDDYTRWYCTGRGCHAKLTVKGLFESVVLSGSPHTHPPLAQEKKSELIGLFGTSHENDT